MDRTIEIVDVPEVVCASVRSKVGNERIGEAMGESFLETMGHLSSQGGPDGPPFAFYHSFDDAETEMDCGWPCKDGLQESERIKRFVIPGGRVVKARHVGPYETLMDTYSEVMAFMTENGLVPSAMWEYYLNDPRDTAPDELITELYWAIV